MSRISQFGLLEMSRQRLRQSFIEWKTELSHSSIVLKILYQIKEAINKKTNKNLIIKVSPFIKEFAISNFKNELDNIEKVNNSKFTIIEDQNLGHGDVIFDDLLKRKRNKPQKKCCQRKNKVTPKKSPFLKH